MRLVEGGCAASVHNNLAGDTSRIAEVVGVLDRVDGVDLVTE